MKVYGSTRKLLAKRNESWRDKQTFFVFCKSALELMKKSASLAKKMNVGQSTRTILAKAMKVDENIKALNRALCG